MYPPLTAAPDALLALLGDDPEAPAVERQRPQLLALRRRGGQPGIAAKLDIAGVIPLVARHQPGESYGSQEQQHCPAWPAERQDGLVLLDRATAEEHYFNLSQHQR